MCKRTGFQQQEKWYEHVPEHVLENDGVKILWDFFIPKDHEIENNKPDTIVHGKMKRECIVIDVAYSFDSRVAKKEVEKIGKYQDLKRELMMIWNCQKICIISINYHWSTGNT